MRSDIMRRSIMKIGDFLKTTKGKVVTLASGAGVIAVGIAVAVLM